MMDVVKEIKFITNLIKKATEEHNYHLLSDCAEGKFSSYVNGIIVGAVTVMSCERRWTSEECDIVIKLAFARGKEILYSKGQDHD